MKTADRNPQAKQMADESMVRNLAAQADAIWPQEEPIFSRHSLVLPAAAAILDVGCGTGEITARIGAVYTNARLTGIDIIESHLELARRRCAALGDRVTFAAVDDKIFAEQDRAAEAGEIVAELLAS